eukprot:NODE_666_length_5382_cov_0.356048.p4 type:complete len:147 gc:universal NODE_666_length_5382_cov_0.356048:1737-2177(+)
MSKKKEIVPENRLHVSDQQLYQQAMYYQHPAMYFIPNFMYQQPRPIQYVPILPKRSDAEHTTSVNVQTHDAVNKVAEVPRISIPIKTEFIAAKTLSPVRSSSSYFPLSPLSPDFLKGLSPMLLAKKRYYAEKDEDELTKKQRLDVD